MNQLSKVRRPDREELRAMVNPGKPCRATGACIQPSGRQATTRRSPLVDDHRLTTGRLERIRCYEPTQTGANDDDRRFHSPILDAIRTQLG